MSSTSEIIGIAVGGGLGFVLVVAGIFYVIRRFRRLPDLEKEEQKRQQQLNFNTYKSPNRSMFHYIRGCFWFLSF